MNYFLAKTEPEVYSIDQLEADGKTVWDGVVNPQAVKVLMSMQAGDRVFFYHSGGISAIVGVATVIKGGRPDTKNPKSALVDMQFLMKLEPATTLHEVKESGEFAEFSLVKQSRLSTMAVPEKFVGWLRKRYPGVAF